MKGFYSFKSLIKVACLFVSIFALSCSDEFQLDKVVGQGSQDQILNDNYQNPNDQNIDSNSNDISQNIPDQNQNQDLDSNQDQGQVEEADLFDQIEALPTSDADKQVLSAFIEGLLNTQNIDMSTLMSAISSGMLGNIGINNDIIEDFLTALFNGDLSQSGASGFAKILLEIEKGFAEKLGGAGTDGLLDHILNADTFEDLLKSVTLEDFVRLYFENSPEMQMLSVILDILNAIQSSND